MQYLTNQQIDKKRYDECVVNAINSLLYARSFYLDSICPQWHALVADDYSWAMPVTWKSKWRTSYLYQPAFTQQLGVFKKTGIQIPWIGITNTLKKKYKFWEININYDSALAANNEKLHFATRTNFILDLNRQHLQISEGYKTDLLKNLSKAARSNLFYCSHDDYNKAIRAYSTLYADRMKHVSREDYERFTQACSKACEQGMIVCREAVNEDGELLAIALLLNDGKRLYNLMNTTTAAGRRAGANHFLLDRLICEFSNRALILDFEGSDLPGIKSFYENFGAVNQQYFFVRYNALPWPLRLLK